MAGSGGQAGLGATDVAGGVDAILKPIGTAVGIGKDIFDMYETRQTRKLTTRMYNAQIAQINQAVRLKEDEENRRRAIRDLLLKGF